MRSTTLWRALAAGAAAGAALAAGPAAARFDYVARVDAARGAGDGGAEARGAVFHDLSRDGARQADEPGVAGVMVSNGLDVVVTGAGTAPTPCPCART